jgi:hypothetical protein
MLYPDAASHPPRSHFRTLSDPALILPERRTAIVVDGKRNPRVLGRLTEVERELFFAQLAAYEAGVSYVHSIDAFRERGQHAEPGQVEPHMLDLRTHEADWTVARDHWRFLRAQRA